VAFEYRRLLKVALAGAVVLVAASRIGQGGTVTGTVSRAILLLGFPLILWGWGFFQADELAELRSIFRPTRRKLQS
jgi:hypothetical protein